MESLARDTESPDMLVEEPNLALTSEPDARWVFPSMCVSGSHGLPAFSPELVCAFLYFWKLLSPTFMPLSGGPGNWPKPDLPCGFLISVSKTFLSPNCLLFGLMVK